MKKTMTRVRKPRKVPFLIADTAPKGQYLCDLVLKTFAKLHDGCKNSIAEMVLFRFGDDINRNRNKAIWGTAGMMESASSPAAVARAWNETMFDLGYEKDNP